MAQALLGGRSHPLVTTQHPLVQRACLRRYVIEQCPLRPLAMQPQPLRSTVQAGAEKRQLPREKFEEHHTKTPHISDRAEVASPDLWRHVRGRSCDNGAPRTPSQASSEQLRNAEVNDDSVRLRMRVIHIRGVQKQYVLRLQVLMHDTHRVHVGYCLQALSGNEGNPSLWQGQALLALLLQDLMELTASCTLHDEVDILIVLIILKESDNVRVVARLQIPDLALHLSWWDLRLALVDGLQHAEEPGTAVTHKVCHAKSTFTELLHRLISEAWPPSSLLDEERSCAR
mmetsp:Transcript_22799/g.42159  ORF Transcript_22799/g.42159 Transcript_22799/m.42159 type:complete len:286 (+) Transcript_22799:258-1115(+)